MSLLSLVAAGLVLASAGVWAGHQFSDVSDTHPFHDEISAVAGAGVTRGFADGTFRPSGNITRQAAAAFFERGLGRAGHRAASRTFGNGSGVAKSGEVVSTSIAAGAAGGGNGMVQVQATLSAYVHGANASACPCDIAFWLTKDGLATTGTRWVTVAPGAGEFGFSMASGAVQHVGVLPADATTAFQLYAYVYDSNVSSVSVSGDLSVSYAALGPDGDNTVAYEYMCSGAESEPNDTQANATPIASGGCMTGRSGHGTDIDYFSIGVSAGQSLRAETKSVDGAGCSSDTQLRLYNLSGQLLVSDYDGGVGYCSRLVASNLAAGSYFVAVSQQAGHAADYRLETVASSSVVDDGPADSVERSPDAQEPWEPVPPGE